MTKKRSNSSEQPGNTGFLAKIIQFFSWLLSLFYIPPPQSPPPPPRPSVATPVRTPVRPYSHVHTAKKKRPPLAAAEPPLLFYHKHKPHYHFTNFAHSPINIKGLVYPTAEHYFQSKKFKDSPDIAKKVREAKTPTEVFTLANGKDGIYKASIRENWHSLSAYYMLKAQLYKYAQNPDLLKALLETGDRLLIEDAGPNDKIWGNGKEGSITDEFGENKLGKILMAVRAVFRKALEEQCSKQEIRVPSGRRLASGEEGTLIEMEVDLKEEYGFNLRLPTLQETIQAIRNR